MNKILFASRAHEWETPQDFFDRLDSEFHFTLDPCATAQNRKCARYFTKEMDGLSQDWGQERVFLNPPYGREVGRWVRKAFEESEKGALVVCLVPARTDTSWWWDYCMKGEVRFIRGRLRFRDQNGSSGPAPFPSAVVIFRDPVAKARTREGQAPLGME